MNDPTRSVQKIQILGPIEKVWRELTKTGEPQMAVYGMQLDAGELKVGSPYLGRTPDGKWTIVAGEVTAIEPMRLFSHTMKFTRYEQPEEVHVIWTLEEIGGGVEVTLTQENLVPGSRTSRDVVGGGKFIMGNLKAIVENGKLGFGTRVMYGMFGLLTPLITPKRSRSENWR
ncbi:MAG: SRPBCC domain-containing protein [Planctomycetota bacterium]